MPASANGGTETRPGGERSTAAAVALAAVLARLPALLSWWCLDDWGQLARAAGRLPAEPGSPARWLSQHLWWSLTWPVLGLHAPGHACLRILLHAIAAVTVTRIARRAGLGQAGQLAAGLLFAVTPIAFTPLYWASGIQELLAGTLALIAVERWLAAAGATGSRRTSTAIVLAGLLGAGSILAKESAFGLPLFFAGWLVLARGNAGEDPGAAAEARLRWGVAAALAALAVLEGALVLTHFATGPRDPYAVGGPPVMLGNLGKFGWWLPTPGPVFTAEVTWPIASVGLALLAAWGIYGAVAWRRGRRLPLAAWASALLSVAPALPLVNRAQPYMGYLAAAAGAMTLASLLPARWRVRPLAAIGLALACAAGGQIDMRAWIVHAGPDGLPADPVVRAVKAARGAARSLLASLPPGATARPFDLVIYQPPLQPGREPTAAADQPNAFKTRPYTALAGPLGASMLLGPTGRAQWGNSLLDAPPDAFVVCERTTGFQAWGSLRNGLLYAAELEVFAGHFDRAVSCLARADALDAAAPLAVPDPALLGIPAAALRPRVESFEEWLGATAGPSGSPVQIDRVRQFTDSLSR